MLIIDTNYFFNRSVAVTPFIENEGYIYDAIKTALTTIASLVSYHNKNDDEIVLAIDDRTKRYWRKAKYPLYKYNRISPFISKSSDIPMKEQLLAEWFKVLAALKGSKFKVIEVKGCEGDDIISALVKAQGEHLGLSPDKDFNQLVSENVTIYDPIHDTYKSEENTLGSGISEEFIISGDNSDNVPQIFAYLKPSKSFTAWFEKKHKMKLTDELYAKLMVEFPQINLDYKLDLYSRYYGNIEFYEDRKMDFKEIFFEKEYDVAHFPSPYDIGYGKNLKNDYFLSLSRQEFLVKHPLLRYNFVRNKKLMDLSLIPLPYVRAILEEYKRPSLGHKRELKEMIKKYELSLLDFI